MPLHLIKLCVGADSIEDLRAWIDENRRAAEARGETYEQTHTTRMVPKRTAELLDGGSLYWVIKGRIEVRQRLLDIRPFTDEDGVGRCRLALDSALAPTRPRGMRPFQGWRYLEVGDAPLDLAEESGSSDLPERLMRELAELGLL